MPEIAEPGSTPEPPGGHRILGRARPVIGHLGRLALGLVFLAAGLLKALDPAEFARQIAAYGLGGPGLAAVAAPLLIALETTLAVALLAGFRPRPAALAGALLLGAFIAIEAYGIAQGRTEACGCFGAYVQRTPQQVIGEDLLFIGLALLSLWGLRSWPGARRRAAAASVAGAAILSFVFALASPVLPLDPLVTRLAEGRSLSDLGLAQALPDLAAGRHLVALIDLTDPASVETAARLNALASGQQGTGVLALTHSTEEEQAAFLWSAGPGFPIRRVDRPVLKPLYRRLPRFFLLDSGRVISVFDGAPPEPKDLLSSTTP
jgi:uncharacterized membrane protein YphA (DoxX/SURF4 family)